MGVSASITSFNSDNIFSLKSRENQGAASSLASHYTEFYWASRRRDQPAGYLLLWSVDPHTLISSIQGRDYLDGLCYDMSIPLPTGYGCRHINVD